MEKAIVPLLLLVVVITALLFVQKWLSHKKEGFELISANNKQTFGSSWSEYANSGAQTFNPIMNLIAPSRNTLLNPNFSQSELKNVESTVQQALAGTNGYPNNPSFDVNPGDVNDILINPETKGSAVNLVKKCEAVMTKDCSAFSDPDFAANCGICFDGGIDSSGSGKVGGLFISEADREAAEYSAKKMSSGKGKSPKSRSPKANYQPSVGKCAPNKFYVSQNKCLNAQRELQCQQQQSFETPGCAQCLQDGDFHYISTDASRTSSVLMLVGNGQATVTKVSGSETPVTLTLGSTSQAINLSILEGDSLQIAISYDAAGTITGTLTVAGYLSGNTASGQFTMDIFSLIPLDTVSNGKPRISGNVTVDTISCTSMRMGVGVKSMNLILTNPFTFLDPMDDKSIMCPTSPYVTNPNSSTILNSSPCFTKGQGVGNYSLPCVQSVFLNVGCTSQGTAYPTNAAEAKFLASGGEKRNPLSVGGMGNMIAELYQKATTGKDLGGKQLSVSDWNDSSMKCLGISRTSVCDQYDQTNGPVGADCLSLLWQNAGQTIPAVGSTYTGSSKITSLREGFVSLPQYCTTKGAMSPIGTDGAPNQQTIDIANSQGGVNNIKSFYDMISKTANDNTQSDDNRALAIEQCYGVTLNPQTSISTDTSEVPSYNHPSVFDRPPPPPPETPPPPPPQPIIPGVTPPITPTPTPTSSPISLQTVIIYQHCNYQGVYNKLPVGRYSVGKNNMGIPNNSLSALIIPRGLKVTLYEYPNFNGRSIVLRNNVPCLTGSEYNVDGMNFNDKTSSVVVEPDSDAPPPPAPLIGGGINPVVDPPPRTSSGRSVKKEAKMASYESCGKGSIYHYTYDGIGKNKYNIVQKCIQIASLPDESKCRQNGVCNSVSCASGKCTRGKSDYCPAGKVYSPFGEDHCVPITSLPRGAKCTRHVVCKSQECKGNTKGRGIVSGGKCA